MPKDPPDLSSTPVLVPPVGGLPEVVTGLSPSLILSGTTAAAISEGLEHALDNLGRLPTADRCRSYAVANFDIDVVSCRVAQVYEAAVSAS